jgi:hypothetical protein
MSIAAASELDSTPSNPLTLPLAAAATCAALADWLIFGWPIGISLALFYGVIGIIAVAVNGNHATRLVQLIMAPVFVAGLSALIEDVNLLSVLAAALATAAFVIVLTTRPYRTVPCRSAAFHRLSGKPGSQFFITPGKLAGVELSNMASGAIFR